MPAPNTTTRQSVRMLGVAWGVSATGGDAGSVGSGAADDELVEDSARSAFLVASDSDEDESVGGGFGDGVSVGGSEVAMQHMARGGTGGGIGGRGDGGGGGGDGGIGGESSESGDDTSDSDVAPDGDAGPLISAPRGRGMGEKRLSATTAVILGTQGHLAALMAGWDTYFMEAEFARQVGGVCAGGGAWCPVSCAPRRALILLPDIGAPAPQMLVMVSHRPIRRGLSCRPLSTTSRFARLGSSEARAACQCSRGGIRTIAP